MSALSSLSSDAPRAVSPADHAALLSLNNAYAIELSWQEPEQFDTLLATAWHTATIGDCEALLVAFDQNAPYDNPNFNWLKARFPTFVYIDRVVVATSGKGYARALYDELRAAAVKAGHERLVCEINVEPPNPGSVAFHEKMGFKEVGRATLANGKTVAYFECLL